MEAGMQVDPDPADEVVAHASTDWDIQKRADYELSVGHVSLCTRPANRTIDEVSENHHHAIDQRTVAVRLNLVGALLLLIICSPWLRNWVPLGIQ